MVRAAIIKLSSPQLALSLLALLFLVLMARQAMASEHEPLERILSTARAFLGETLGSASDAETRIEIGQLDNRLRLERCAEPPSARFGPGARREGNTTINIRCERPVAWSIFVPARIERYCEVVVVEHPLSRQQMIQPGDVRLERRETSTLASGYFTTTTAAIGQAATRRLLPGQVLTSAHLAPHLLIERGQEVTLYSARPGLTVRMKGEALENGAAGQRIRVRNRSSKQVVEGYVEPSGAVRVAL